jgi:hypothetical protein
LCSLGVDDADDRPPARWRCARASGSAAGGLLRRAACAKPSHAPVVVAQRLAGVRRGVRLHILGRALHTTWPPASPPSGPRSTIQSARGSRPGCARSPAANARVQQLAQRAHQLGDVVEVQAGGGLVEQEQRALLRRPAGAGRPRIGQEAGQLQALRLAAAERGHGLAQAHVVQAHVDDGLQRAVTSRSRWNQCAASADRQVQHVGHAELVWRRA